MRRINNPETKTHNQRRIDRFEVDRQALSWSQQMQHEAHCTHYTIALIETQNLGQNDKTWN
jgi:hypothetical protein